MKRPGTKVVFVARAENAPPAEGFGVILPSPLDPDLLIATVSRLLVTPEEESRHRLEMTRIVTTTYRYKPPPKRKGRKLAEIIGPAIVTAKRSRRPAVAE